MRWFRFFRLLRLLRLVRFAGVGRAVTSLERHGIHRDLFGRFELLDLALDEAAAELDDDLSELPRKSSDSAARS